MADEVSTPDPRKQERKRKRRRIAHLLKQGAISAILLAVVAGIYLYFERADHAPSATQAQGPQGPMPVNAIVVEPRDVPLEPQYLAQTVASQSVEIQSRVAGFLRERTFEEGERVEKGQVLYQIDRQPFEVTLSQANAQLAAAKARLQRAQQQVERFGTLATQQSAAASELEQWQEEQQVAAAEVELQQARVAQVQLDLNYTTIESPITGVIGQSRQDVGSYLSPPADSFLATVQQVDPIYVRFSVSEQDLLEWQRLVASGAVRDVPVEALDIQVVLPDGRVYPHSGKISYVDVAIDPSSGTAVTRATVPNPDGLLLPGQYVEARIAGVERIGAILVPQGAVMQTPTGANLYVIDDEGRAQIRPVTVGTWLGNQWLIESGLDPGDRVIIDHLLQVRPGVPVEPTFVGSGAADTGVASTQPATRPADVPAGV